MADQILHSRADGTISKYYSHVKQFKEFCSKHGFQAYPAFPIHVAMYLSELIDLHKSDTVVSAAFYAIRWLHEINDLTDPTKNAIVIRMLECAKRTNSKPVQKKDVLLPEHLVKLCDLFSTTKDIIVLRDLTMILLCFAAFFRYNEVSDLRCCDVKFFADYIEVFVKKSKTDVYREGKYVVIAKGVTSACPVSMLQRYMNCAGLCSNSDMYLFRPACRSGSRCFLLKKDKKLSYSRARECIVSKLKLVAPDMNLGTHSLRASGASAVANAEGVSERCLKRHGRWKSDLAKDSYIKDSIQKRLSVSKTLML
ncbi:integrase/recombinase xerD homolog [Ruditapes philippinarum]|uniref:integrase/recombinase xerD homolog n=1 Tax=Ruditapes philippinarum TaxID=129788 RepID=UPI00295AB211|nr:integrase/recombinase xerD homolog [Ruditapes philippinarum]